MSFSVVVNASNGHILKVVNQCFSLNSRVGKVFNPDPGSYLENYQLPDSNDQNYYPITEAYSQEVLPGLIQSQDEKWRLQGEYAQSINIDPDGLPLAEENEPIFLYNRDNPFFEEVNAYFHIDKQIRYIKTVGFHPKWATPLSDNDTAMAFDARFLDNPNNAFYDCANKLIKLGQPQNQADYGEDLTVIAHELGHAFHDAFLMGGGLNPIVLPNGSNFEFISEGIAEYFGISYRRSKSLYRPNARSNWASIKGATSIHDHNSLYTFDKWNNWFIDVEPRRYTYASALMDLEYLDATNPALGVNLGRDVTHRLLCQSMHYVTSASDHVSNVLAMFQADIDLYQGAHLPQLIEVYTRRKLFNQILTQMPANNLVNGIAMVNEGFEVPTNRTLTVGELSYFVLNGNITVQPNATLVFNERTRVFNPGNFTIHVHGTLQIAGNTILPAHIVVHNGGTLLLNEGIAFA